MIAPQRPGPFEDSVLTAAERDAAWLRYALWLEAALDRVRVLPDKWLHEILAFPHTREGRYASVAIELCGQEVTAALEGKP